MRTQEIKFYQFSELNETAKQKAREWYRRGALDLEWWEHIYEDAARCGIEIQGFDCDRGNIEGTKTGTFLDTANAILKEHGEVCETYKLAKIFIEEITPLETALNDAEGKDEALATLRQLGAKISKIEDEFLHAVLQEYLNMLREEADFILSDEQVDESIKANGYEFTEDGTRF